MEGDRLNLFNDLFNNKKRKVELASSQLKSNLAKTKKFTFKQNTFNDKNDINVYMGLTIKTNMLNSKINNFRYEVFKSKLNGYKEDFDSKIHDLTRVIQKKCAKRLYDIRNKSIPNTIYKCKDSKTVKLPNIDFKYGKTIDENNEDNNTQRNEDKSFSSARKKKMAVSCYKNKYSKTQHK